MKRLCTAVTTMPSLTSILNTLTQTYSVSFQEDATFHYDPANKTVHYIADIELLPYLFHEVGHAHLGHDTYNKDIELIAMERDAWSVAHTIAKKFNISINEDTEQEALDTYREWLHHRSRCPSCDSTGIQTKVETYSCCDCGQQWSVNEAKACRLYRKKIK